MPLLRSPYQAKFYSFLGNVSFLSENPKYIFHICCIPLAGLLTYGWWHFYFRSLLSFNFILCFPSIYSFLISSAYSNSLICFLDLVHISYLYWIPYFNKVLSHLIFAPSSSLKYFSSWEWSSRETNSLSQFLKLLTMFALISWFLRSVSFCLSSIDCSVLFRNSTLQIATTFATRIVFLWGY